MGAIWGYLGLPPREGEMLLRRMGDSLNHRSPGGKGMICRGNWGLGMGLSGKGTQPSTGGRKPLPLRTEGDQAFLAVDGDSRVDWQGLLAAYMKDHDGWTRKVWACALALYDSRDETLFLARAPFGIKPLYYYIEKGSGGSGGPIYFASEVKPLLSLLPALQADPESLCEYLSFQILFEEKTLFNGIRKTRPGWLYKFDRTGCFAKESFWTPESRGEGQPELENLLKNVQNTLRRAVGRSLEGADRVGLSLSGGIDSSAVGIIASEKIQVQAFTGAFKEGEAFDETPYARLAAQKMEAPYHLILPSPLDFQENFLSLIGILEEPAGGPGAFPQLMVARVAREHVSLLLSGEGGDELFAGYARYLALRAHDAFREQFCGRFGPREKSEVIEALPELDDYERLLKDTFSLPKEALPGERYFHLIYRGRRLLPLLSKDMQDEMEVYNPLQRLMGLFSSMRGSSELEKVLAFERTHLLTGLLHIDDRVNQSCGLEAAAPFLSPEVVNLSLSLPLSALFLKGRSKGLLRNALDGILPDAIRLRRDKKGFPVPLHLWAKDGLRDFLFDTLLGRKARERGIFNPKSVEHYLADPPPFDRTLWGMLCLEGWFQLAEQRFQTNSLNG